MVAVMSFTSFNCSWTLTFLNHPCIPGQYFKSHPLYPVAASSAYRCLFAHWSLQVSLVLLLVSNDCQVEGKNYFLHPTSSSPKELLFSSRDHRLFATAAHHWLMLYLGYQFCKTAARLVGAQTPLFHRIMLFLGQWSAFTCAVDEVPGHPFPQHHGSPPWSIALELVSPSSFLWCHLPHHQRTIQVGGGDRGSCSWTSCSKNSHRTRLHCQGFSCITRFHKPPSMEAAEPFLATCSAAFFVLMVKKLFLLVG